MNKRNQTQNVERMCGWDAKGAKEANQKIRETSLFPFFCIGYQTIYRQDGSSATTQASTLR